MAQEVGVLEGIIIVFIILLILMPIMYFISLAATGSHSQSLMITYILGIIIDTSTVTYVIAYKYGYTEAFGIAIANLFPFMLFYYLFIGLFENILMSISFI